MASEDPANARKNSLTVLLLLAVIGALFGAGGAVLSLAPLLLVTAVPLGLVTGAVVLAVDRRLGEWRG